MVYFSVVIPLYNKENYILETIKSVLNQSFTSFEIIIVNDCSTDSSLIKISELNNSNLQILNHQNNKGLSASRNTGIRNAKGKFIAFLDADDIWKKDFLQTIYNLTITFPNAAIFGTDFEMVYKGGKILPNIKNIPDSKSDHFLIDNYFKANLYYPIYCFSSVCFSKIVFETVGYFDEKITFAEDIDFNIRVNSSFQLAYCNKPLAQYVMFSENQITNSNFDQKVLPDLKKYKELELKNDYLNKYIDFQSYSIGINYKLINNEKFKNFTQDINYNNLNLKQIILLKMPKVCYKLTKKMKLFFMKKGIQLTTFK